MVDPMVWAVVATLDPLTVTTRDGVTRDAMLIVDATLTVAMRVRVELPRVGPALIHGRANGKLDTRWQTLTLEAGYTATQAVQARLIGEVVYLRGVITPSTDWGSAGTNQTVVATAGVPADMRPASFAIATQAAPAAAGVPLTFRVTPNANGNLQIACDTSSSSAGVSLGGVSWPVG